MKAIHNRCNLIIATMVMLLLFTFACVEQEKNNSERLIEVRLENDSYDTSPSVQDRHDSMRIELIKKNLNVIAGKMERYAFDTSILNRRMQIFLSGSKENSRKKDLVMMEIKIAETKSKLDSLIQELSNLEDKRNFFHKQLTVLLSRK